MNKNKKRLIITIIVVLVIVVGCGAAFGGGSDEKEATNITPDTHTATSADQPESGNTAPDTQTAEPAEKANETAANKVLYDDGGIKISLKKFDNSIFGTELNLAIENNTDQDLIFQADDVSVNGYMVTSVMSTNVSAGKKANGDLTIFKSSLEDNEITEVEEVEFKIKIEDSSYRTLNTVGPFTVAAK